MIKPRISDYKYDKILISHIESAAIFSPMALAWSKYNIGIVADLLLRPVSLISLTFKIDKELKPWRYGPFPRKLKKTMKLITKEFNKTLTGGS